MIKKLGFVAAAIAIYFVGMLVGHTQSPDATAVRQNGSLQSQLSSCTAAYQTICSDVEIQNKSLIQLGAPSSSVTLHCSANMATSSLQ